MALSTRFVHSVLEVAERAGVAKATLLDAASLDPARLEDADGRVSLAESELLCQLALKLTGDPALGLHLGELAGPETHGLVAHLIAHAPTLREGVETLITFHRLVSDQQPWQLVERGRRATLLCDVGSGPLLCRRIHAENSLAGFYRLVRFFRRDARVESVSFQHPPPPYRLEYTRIFEGAECFLQPFTGLVVARELLDATPSSRDPQLHTALRAHAEQRVMRLAGSETHAHRVRDLLIAQEWPGKQCMSWAARALGLSVRSLRRKLAGEGVSFNTLTEDARAVVAKRLLMQGTRTIQETSDELGFSDSSAFHRAFKRWTGTTPSAFRAQRSALKPEGPRFRPDVG